MRIRLHFKRKMLSRRVDRSRTHVGTLNSFETAISHATLTALPERSDCLRYWYRDDVL